MDIASIVVALLVSVLAVRLPPHPAGHRARDDNGEVVARRLQRRYAQSRQRCGGCRAPPCACSGILMRSTVYADHYFSWRPNPATADWGVVFSWLRQDSDFADSFPSGNGFIAYPSMLARHRGLVPFRIRCVYPSDAWTTGPDRCRCHAQGELRTMTRLAHHHFPSLRTADAWLDIGYTDDMHQSAFAPEDWHIMIDIRRREGLRWRNEVIVEPWQEVDDRLLPIEAFFHQCRGGMVDAASLASARADQRELKKLTGRRVPIVRWECDDTSPSASAFRYVLTDQCGHE